LRPWRERYLDMRVAPNSLSRALRIMNALIKGLEVRGFEVETEENKTPSTYVLILDEKIYFSLNERVRREDHVPTEKEKRKLERYRFAYVPPWDFIPTGELTLRIDTYGKYGTRKTWADARTQRVEELLNDFVFAAIKTAGCKRQERLEREEYYRRLEEERRRREELERLRQAEEDRRRDLENKAELWAKANQLRAYIREVEKAASARPLSQDFLEKLKKWLSWATQHADRLDPLESRLPFEKDPMVSGS